MFISFPTDSVLMQQREHEKASSSLSVSQIISPVLLPLPSSLALAPRPPPHPPWLARISLPVD